MVEMRPIDIAGHMAVAIEVDLPKTHLAMVATDIGYVMCGALDVNLLNTVLKSRGIVAGRAVGVRSVEQLLEAPLESLTDGMRQLGAYEGMSCREALSLLF